MLRVSFWCDIREWTLESLFPCHLGSKILMEKTQVLPHPYTTESLRQWIVSGTRLSQLEQLKWQHMFVGSLDRCQEGFLYLFSYVVLFGFSN